MVVYVLAPESRMTGLWKMVTVGFGTLVVLSGGFWAGGSAGCEAADMFLENMFLEKLLTPGGGGGLWGVSVHPPSFTLTCRASCWRMVAPCSGTVAACTFCPVLFWPSSWATEMLFSLPQH